MGKQKWLVLASVMCVLGCSEDSGVSDNASTKYCIPSCDLMSEKCVDGTCVSLCPDGCPEGEHCEFGECVPMTCVPECSEDATCVNGECVPKPVDPNHCQGLICKDSMTRCNTETGQWAECPLGTGCHLGYCLEGLGVECTEGMCSEDGTKACAAGKWVSCGSVEVCTNGKCNLIEGACEPGTCSEDGAYLCNEAGEFEKCGTGMLCQDGDCNLNYDRNAAMLWTLCDKNSDCPSGMCLFELTPTRLFTSTAYNLVNVETIPVSVLDHRIPEGSGVCSLDCTKDSSICDSLNTGNTQYTCQLAFAGDSPYPPKDDYGPLNLPFHKAPSFKISDMETAPYASICRPNDAYGRHYSKTFCTSCNSSADCGADEVCAGGFCASQCGTNDMCPLGFSCIDLSGDSELENKVCMPKSGTCGSCLDLDGDGQGFGDCRLAGYDCDPGNPDIYYTTDLPKVCTHDITDTNCNGKIDTFELLGSAEHCRFCDDACLASSTGANMTRRCELLPDKELDDYAFSSFNASDENTYLTYCHDICSEGWGDCNRDYLDGCEVDLNGSGGVKYSYDGDQDGRGRIDDAGNYDVYCCGYDTSNCYAYQNSRYTPYGDWGRPNNDAWDNVQNGYELISSDITDCNDDDRFSYNGNAEICDGKNNACNDTADGKDDIFIDDITSEEIQLDGSCKVYNDNGLACADGKVECIKGDNEQFEMKCVATIVATETGDQLCDGIDNNCNGEVDESYVPVFTEATKNPDGSINICTYRLTQCKNGSVYDTNGGNQLFTARAYDFYGDGIDSNCDGHDFDVNNAIFISQGGGGAANGKDLDPEHNGLFGRPVKSLQKALEKACNNNTANSKYICHDILVMESAAIDSTNTSEPGTWASKGSVSVPTFSTRHNLYPSHIRLSDDTDSLKDYKCTANGCMNNYLLPNESVPPEAVRIYGGFKSEEKDNKKYVSRSKSTSTIYSFTYKPNGKSARFFALVAGDTKYPLSLKLDKVPIELKSQQISGSTSVLNQTNSSLQDGLMLVGLTCGTKGCRHLTLNDSPIKVTGNTGRDNSNLPHLSNIWSEERMQGIKGRSFYEDWKYHKENWTAFEINRNQNTMFYDYFDESKSLWSSVSSYSYGSCPDGSSPRGGAPASWCCRGTCGPDYDTSKKGENGTGNGKGGESLRLGISGGGCNESDWYEGKGQVDYYERYKNGDGTYVMGGNGSHGRGGAGGTNNGVTCEKVFQTGIDGFYVSCKTSAGNGKPGEAGGGGGGGAVHHCFRHKRYGTPAWIHGGGGGAGGCGGYGGKAGGMGISATGLILNAPANTSDKFSYQNSNSSVTATAGKGGEAQAGQDGVYGGWRGDGFGYGKEGAANVDMHCHRTTAGGVGGTGGGGGAGANGVSGQAFGVVFIDNKSINVNTSEDTLNSYGYEYTSSLKALLEDPGKVNISVSTQNHGGNGGSGTDGKAPYDYGRSNAGAAVLNTAGRTADLTSTLSTKGHSKTIDFLTNSNF